MIPSRVLTIAEADVSSLSDKVRALRFEHNVIGVGTIGSGFYFWGNFIALLGSREWTSHGYEVPVGGMLVSLLAWIALLFANRTYHRLVLDTEQRLAEARKRLPFSADP